MMQKQCKGSIEIIIGKRPGEFMAIHNSGKYIHNELDLNSFDNIHNLFKQRQSTRYAV